MHLKIPVRCAVKVIRSNFSYLDEDNLEALIKEDADSWVLNLFIKFTSWITKKAS